MNTQSSSASQAWNRPLSSDELRSKYLGFFKEQDHAVIPSASLIPDGDASVLFTTAGMQPLVPYLMGRDHPAGKRLTGVQKCVRTNDLEEVGDLTHLTMFEMLGNWSLGDYYKNESIRWSYEFLTREDCLAIPHDLLWVTCFEGNEVAPRDEEAAAVWRDLGVPDERILFLGMEDNWWAMGPTGPCGPDTEIFMDMTQTPCENGDKCLPSLCDCGRFFEIWNNVFMAFNRTADGIEPLPQQNVDTGMGLERVLAAINGVESVYETHSFQPTIQELISHTPHSREDIYGDEKKLFALRVVSDHLRTATFMMGDQQPVLPSNTGQGYVLRRLIRRAVRYCEHLDLAPENWVAAHRIVLDQYSAAYPELTSGRLDIGVELSNEVGRFMKTVQKGQKVLEQSLEELKAQGKTELTGDIAFRLFDTYGYPVEFTQELASEQGVTVDMTGFRAAGEKHRETSRAAEAAKSGLADDSEESVRYHTATHLLHAALRQKFGPTVMQRGSNITSERMRFDFSFERALTKDEVREVEQMVQEWIDAGMPVEQETMGADEAREKGAIGLFSDKYDDVVSVYSIGDVSMEFCGGPHVANTNEIGQFKIKKEQSSSAGVRRIRAVVD